MFTKVYNIYKNFEDITHKILKRGLLLCFAICVFSLISLLTYIRWSKFSFLFYLGIYTFKFSLILAVEFIVCSFVVDGIKKQQI